MIYVLKLAVFVLSLSSTIATGAAVSPLLVSSQRVLSAEEKAAFSVLDMYVKFKLAIVIARAANNVPSAPYEMGAQAAGTALEELISRAFSDLTAGTKGMKEAVDASIADIATRPAILASARAEYARQQGCSVSQSRRARLVAHAAWRTVLTGGFEGEVGAKVGKDIQKVLSNLLTAWEKLVDFNPNEKRPSVRVLRRKIEGKLPEPEVKVQDPGLVFQTASEDLRNYFVDFVWVLLNDIIDIQRDSKSTFVEQRTSFENFAHSICERTDILLTLPSHNDSRSPDVRFLAVLADQCHCVIL